MKFNKNDVVRCVDTSCNVFITKGNNYIVLSSNESGRRISLVADDGEVYFYSQNLFEIVESKGDLIESIKLAQSLIGKPFIWETKKYIGKRVKVYLHKDEFDNGYGSLNAKQEVAKRGWSVCIHGIDDLEYPVNDVEIPPDSITMKLTSDYDAIIYKDKVEVGCQTITKEVLKELLEKMESL